MAVNGLNNDVFSQVDKEMEGDGFFDRFEKKPFPERFDSQGRRVVAASRRHHSVSDSTNKSIKPQKV